MITVIGVRFKKAGKVYYFDPNDFWPKPGEEVIVQTSRGIELGEVVTGTRTVSDDQIQSPLKKVIRIATPEDKKRAAMNEQCESDAMRICQEKIKLHKLEMKLVSVEYTFDNSRIIFYFTANDRVDFRELVKDLASVFHTRIELRQIGARDEAKMLGGIGSCGRSLCCATHLGDFQPVSIKMAKEQNLSLNPTKISGLCGRLLCCLKYEQENYEFALKRLPKVGRDIVTPDGVGVMTEINAIREIVKVRIRTNDDSFDVREYPIDDVRRPGPDDAAAVREVPQPKRSTPAGSADENKPEEENRKKHYPHQKVTRTMSTDQFLEKMNSNEVVPDEPEKDKPKEKNTERPPHKRHHRSPRHRSGDNGEHNKETHNEAKGGE